MECFNHHGKVSVALCKVCHKGLCRECAHQYVGKGFVCNDTCGEQATLQDKVMEWSANYVVKKGSFSGLSRQYGYMAFIFTIIGLALIGQEIYSYFLYNYSITYPSIVFGVSMLLIASIFFRGMSK
jgi:hypothetical protein